MPAKPKSPSPKSDPSAVSSKKSASLSDPSIDSIDAEELDPAPKVRGSKKKPTMTELRQTETLDLLEE